MFNALWIPTFQSFVFHFSMLFMWFSFVNVSHIHCYFEPIFVFVCVCANMISTTAILLSANDEKSIQLPAEWGCYTNGSAIVKWSTVCFHLNEFPILIQWKKKNNQNSNKLIICIYGSWWLVVVSHWKVCYQTVIVLIQYFGRFIQCSHFLYMAYQYSTFSRRTGNEYKTYWEHHHMCTFDNVYMIILHYVWARKSWENSISISGKIIYLTRSFLVRPISTFRFHNLYECENWKITQISTENTRCLVVPIKYGNRIKRIEWNGMECYY